MSRKGRNAYPADWSAIATRVKEEADWCCVRCGHPHDTPSGHTLTVHHLSMDKSDNRWWNTIALCQRCHLSIQARVDLTRPWVMVPHSAWFGPYVAGFYAAKYLGEHLSREEVMARLDELLALEAAHVLGVGA